MLILIKSWREGAQRQHWGQRGDSCDRNSWESCRDSTTQIPNSSMQTALSIWCLHLPRPSRSLCRKNGQDPLSPPWNTAGCCSSYSFTLLTLWDLRWLKNNLENQSLHEVDPKNTNPSHPVLTAHFVLHLTPVICLGTFLLVHFEARVLQISCIIIIILIVIIIIIIKAQHWMWNKNQSPFAPTPVTALSHLPLADPCRSKTNKNNWAIGSIFWRNAPCERFLCIDLEMEHDAVVL